MCTLPEPLFVPEHTGDWTPEQFEQAGHLVLELIREHLQQLEETPVLPDIGAAELRQLLGGPLPEQATDFTTILTDTKTRVIPHLTKWNHPRFFAYFPVGSSGPGAVADLLGSALNINAMLWKTAPAAVALEEIVLRWMAEMVGYDTEADGTLINGASLATFYALAAAREATGFDIRQHGMTGRDLPRLRVYSSEHAHSSIDKAVIGIGVGLDNLVKIETDSSHRLDPARLDAAIRADIVRGYKPLAVVAVVGTTSTGAVDPIDDIAAVCREHNVWLHVDAAFGGFYNIVPDVREQVGELHGADSLVVNPHKVLFTPLEVTAFYCKRRGALADAFSLIPPYLRTDDGENVTNPMDYTLQLGRRFNSLKVWWVIRAFGRDGLRSRMEHQLRLTEALRDRIAAHPDFETFAEMTGHDTPYPLVCFRAVPRGWRHDAHHSGRHGGQHGELYSDPHDELHHEAGTDGNDATQRLLAQAIDRFNEALLERVNADGRHFISHTVVREGYILRASIGNIRTDEEHVNSLWQALQDGYAELSMNVDDWF